MRKVIIMFALAMGIASAHAQENVTVETTNGSNEQPTLTKEVYPQKEADGDLYHGLSRKLTFDRMIPPHGLEVTYDKTVHVIFPAEVRYVDLGSPDLIAGKADGAENVIRVKATVRNFPNETNMSVITEDGSFYTFNVKYAAEPLLLNVEMCDFIHDGSTVNRPNNCLLYTSHPFDGKKQGQFMNKNIVRNRKTILSAALIIAATASAFAQGNGIAGINEATSMVSSYFDPGTKLIYAIGAVVGLIGGVKVYGKFSSGDPDTSKTAASWFGACIFLIVAATILRSFFL